jgi:hypothetical protein
MSGVDLSESTLARTTAEVGDRSAGLLAQGVPFSPRVVWPWRRHAQGRTVAYLSIDAPGIRQQGPQGQAAEGRLAYVGRIFNPLPPKERVEPIPNARRQRLQARYRAGRYALEERGPLLRPRAARGGREQAERWVVLTDGGAGLEEFARNNFNRPDRVLLLDFYHAASYREKLAKALHPQDETASPTPAEQWCSLRTAEGGAVMREVLRPWDGPARKAAALREQGATVQTYVENNLHRLEYPEYLTEGWQIGRGVIESACKTVVSQRLKGAGLRWAEAGANALCHVRALYRSDKGQWQDFWDRQCCGPLVQQAA